MPFTPLGIRTLEGFRKQYGEDGELKFKQAMDRGLIERGKMERPHKTVATPNSAKGLRHTVEATNNEGKPPPSKPQVTVPPAQPRGAPGAFQARGGSPG